jgi:hypothetical protein
MVNKAAIAGRDIPSIVNALRRSAGTGKEPVVIINADAKAAHQSVIDVMQAAQQAGCRTSPLPPSRRNAEAGGLAAAWRRRGPQPACCSRFRCSSKRSSPCDGALPAGLLHRERLPVPVVVVGNITSAVPARHRW